MSQPGTSVLDQYWMTYFTKKKCLKISGSLIPCAGCIHTKVNPAHPGHRTPCCQILLRAHSGQQTLLPHQEVLKALPLLGPQQNLQRKRNLLKYCFKIRVTRYFRNLAGLFLCWCHLLCPPEAKLLGLEPLYRTDHQSILGKRTSEWVTTACRLQQQG